LIQPITIPKTSDLDSLVQTLNFKLGSLVASINSERPSTDQSLNGHRLINVGSPSRPTDAVTVDYLDRQLKDLHQRLKTSTIHYVNAQLGAPPTSSEGVLADIPSTLTAEDAGYLYYATDYLHTYKWNGSGWEYASWDRISGEVAAFVSDPGTGWALCDGSSVTRTLSNATTTSFTTPDLRGLYVKGSTTYTGAVVNAVAPAITGSITAASAGTPSGSVASSFTGGGAGITGLPSGSTTVQSGVGASVASTSHIHATPDDAGTVSSVFTGSPMGTHSHSDTLAVDNTTDVAHINFPYYFRL
jgi:hypothetical protein